MIDVNDMVKPETELEKSIIQEPEFVAGALHGKPRKGHPEGEVIYHIAEVLKNADKYSDASNRSQLRLIAIIHDSFKYKVNRDMPKAGENHHGMIARRFGIDNDTLDIIELCMMKHITHSRKTTLDEPRD